jgi:hypothetical protein
MGALTRLNTPSHHAPHPYPPSYNLMMILDFVGKVFDFLVGGPRDLGPRDGEQVKPREPTMGTRPMDHSPWEAGELQGIFHPDKQELFRWILLLLRLVTTFRLGFPLWKPKPNEADSVSRFHTQSYGYLGALTTLLLRRDEIVAAVESSPGSGFIMSDDKSTGPEVRWRSYLHHLARVIHISVRRFRTGGSGLLRYQVLFSS